MYILLMTLPVTHLPKKRDKAQKIKLAKMAAQALVHEEEQRHAQEQAKKEKQRKGKKVVHFNL